MKTKSQLTRISVFAVLNLCATLCAPALSLFQPISLPDSTYVSATTRLSISAPNGSFVGGLSDTSFSLTFGGGGGYAPPIRASTFASWSSPPYSESATPGQVLMYADTYLPSRSLYITFSKPLQTFGVEIEVEMWNTTSPITATFYDGTTPLGSVTQTIGGWQGARLFAAHTDTANFDSVVIYDPSSASGFGIGQFRYAVVPEPATSGLLLVASCCFNWSHRIRTRRTRSLHSTPR
jgi:hypothetical protein